MTTISTAFPVADITLQEGVNPGSNPSPPPAANGAHSNGKKKALWLSQEDNDQQRPQMTAH